MIRSTAPIVSEFAHVIALNGPDFGLRIQWVATAATSMAMHMPTMGWLRKKFFIAGNSRSGRQVEPHLVRLSDQCKNSTARGIGRRIGNSDALRCGGEIDRRRHILSRTDAHHATMPTRSLRQRHPCQRRLAVLRVIHRCFRSSRIEGRKSCIDVGWYKHFQSGFLTNASRFVADEAGQYDDGGYSSDHQPAGNSDQGAPRRTRLLATRRLLTWRPVLPAGRARGSLMLCFCLTHVSGIR